MTLRPTPGQTIGPFFHYALPFDGDSTLVPPSDPRALRLSGTVRDGAGRPIPDALLEIRQSAPDGVVPLLEGSLRRDRTGFTGWGRTATDAGGRYAFSTLEPGSVAGEPPFFAVVVFARGLLDRLHTRAYLPLPADRTDGFLDALDPADRTRLVTRRQPAGDLRFDICLQGVDQTPFLRYRPSATGR